MKQHVGHRSESMTVSYSLHPHDWEKRRHSRSGFAGRGAVTGDVLCRSKDG
jgi:hypothetical protein